MKLTFLIPRYSTSSRCASTMSLTLTIGKLVPYRRPLTGFTLDGPLRGNNAVKTCTTLHPARKSVTMERYNLRTPLRELPAINYYIFNFKFCKYYAIQENSKVMNNMQQRVEFTPNSRSTVRSVAENSTANEVVAITLEESPACKRGAGELEADRWLLKLIQQLVHNDATHVLP